MSTEKTVSESSAREKGEKPIVTAGQHIHKWGTYLSVDWVFNTIVGVGFAYWGKYTKLGQKLWSGPLQEVGTFLLKPIFKSDLVKGGKVADKAFEALQYSVGKFELFFSIIFGGMMTIPPLMWLENKKNRINITRGLDETIHGKEVVASDPKFEESYKAIEEEPKKDFSAGMKARFVALAPLLAWVLIPNSWGNRPVFHSLVKASDLYFGKIGKAVDSTARKMGFSPNKLKDGVELVLENSEGTINIVEKPVSGAEKFKNVTTNAIPMDFGLGLPYAGLHAIFYNMFAGGKEKKSERNPQTSDRQTEREKITETTHVPASKVRDVANRERMADAPKLEHAVERA